MDMSLRKGFVSRSPHRSLTALLVAAGVLGSSFALSLALPSVSSAAVPLSGLNCAASDGKISGRGASYQAHAEAAFAAAYRDDFCGNVAEQYAGDPAGNTMVAYNYPAAEAASATGASAGLKAASCRTDAYAGDSLPYTEAQFGELNAAPGTTGGCKLAFAPPFTPTATRNEFPNANDTTAPVMSFPVAGSSVAIAVNFGTACTKEPTGLKLTAKEISRIFGGDAATWADSELAENNPMLATDGCTGAITRVVREDSSGTTEIFKAYLVRAANERSAGIFTCAAGKKWSEYTAKNTEWPGKQKPTEEGTCSSVTTAATSGGPAEIAKLKEVQGGVGYADLPDEANQSPLVTANVFNATGTNYVSPIAGKGANCVYAGEVSPPGNGSASEAVGVGNTEGKNWATNAEPNEQNVTDLGNKYPICGITFDLVYTGLDGISSSNAISPLTADQRRTLYSYFTFVLSSTAQNLLSNIYYAPVPSAWLQELREGFQENF
jgi:ABC-type phosphate transport system substrate-binding protein